VARTKVIDDLIIEAISDGCDRVLNLAAGLDTRPYRLDLPEDFPSIEADLPQLLAEKERALADETPRCRLSRHAVDLADPAARDAFLNEELAGATKALVLTEGLLMYLEDSDVRALSTAFTRPEVAGDARFLRPWTSEADEQEEPRHDGQRTIQVRTRQRPCLLRRPRLAGRRDGFGLQCGASIRSAAGVDATAGVATSARSAQSGQQYLQRGCPPYALRVTTSER
jgi:methyltransferase (TIGR00027 family)